jgi:alcohol dehydrogenase class IV
MLPYVMEFNLIGNPERFARIAELMGEPVQGLQLRERAARSVVAVKKLIADLRLPKTLGEVGMTKKDIPAMVDYVMKYNMYQVNDNPRMLDRADLEYILETAL